MQPRKLLDVRLIVQVGGNNRWNPAAERQVEMALTLVDLSGSPYMLNDLVRPLLESCIAQLVYEKFDAEAVDAADDE